MTNSEGESGGRGRQWYIVRRWQEYDGEWRANALRALCVGAFYATQLVHYHGFATDIEAERPFHRAATALVVVWIAVALAVHLALRRGVLPWGLKYVTTAIDCVLLTAAALLGSGPDSPVVLGYFLIVAMTTLRFNLNLVRCGTLASLCAFLAIVVARDPSWLGETQQVAVVRRLVMFLSLGAEGIVLGQVVRRAEQLAQEYERRCVAARGETP